MAGIDALTSSRAQLLQQVGMRVMAKQQEAARAQGDAAVALLEQAAQMQGELSPQSGSVMNGGRGTDVSGLHVAGGSGSASRGSGTIGSMLDVTA